MALFEDHLYNGVYPYLTPEQFTADNSTCPLARGLDPDDLVVIDAITDASLTAYYLTGKQFNGTGTTTVRPYSGDCDSCLDCAPYKLTMGLWPVTSIVTVRENGEDTDPEEYHIDEWRYIVKNNGEAFPRCSNWYAASAGTFDTESDGWVFEVTVEHGIPGPPLLRRAVAALACQLLDQSSIDEDCEDCNLPQRLTNISRQGVSFSVEDLLDLVKGGSTGVYSLDLAIKVFNPSGLQSPSFVWAPEIARGKRRYLETGVGTS